MLFNSLQFLIFFAGFYALYLIVHRFGRHKLENRLLLIASYAFYAAWDWRFLSLIFVSTVVDYYCGRKIHASVEAVRRKQYLFYSIFTNLFILGFFKYFDFFAQNLKSLLGVVGLAPSIGTLNLILPIGISFYTFQTLSYTIDIYRRKLKPTNDFLDFALFVSFFPQLVAGPIERAKNLLPQISKPRIITGDKIYKGVYLIFWGLFLKVFVADNLANIVDPVFLIPDTWGGANILLALYAFAFQIFCDFAGYSNIARGLAKCMGIELMVNFRLPYFATNPRQFWRRWHISLSTWFRDYLYIPLGGNRRGKTRTVINLLITMVLCGLWHGAAWTFVIWGLYHSALLIIHRSLLPILETIGSVKNIVFKRVWKYVRIFIFFNLTAVGWLFFRAESLGQARDMLLTLVQFRVTHWPVFKESAGLFLFFIALLLIVQIIQHRKNDLLAIYKLHPAVKAVFYIICYFLILLYGVTSAQEFIYFQF